jgi:hypothetical protein
MPGTAGHFYFLAKRCRKIMFNSGRIAVQYPGGGEYKAIRARMDCRRAGGAIAWPNVKAGKCRSALKPGITVEQLHYVILSALVVQTA